VNAGIRAFVQTRGTARATDYAFLGDAPPEPWWRAYRDATAFDHPTVLVTSDGKRWAAYLSGIPSARVDAVGTVVRYTLVLDGPCGVDGACVGAAVAAWLDDVAEGSSGPGRLSAALDARFPHDDVQRWLGAAGPAAASITEDVRQRAMAALAALPAPGGAADEPGSWLGAVRAPAGRRAFAARVGALVAGQPGRALLLNLVGGPDDAAALLDPASPTAVLVDGSAPTRVTPLRVAVEAKKAPAAATPAVRRAGVAAVAGIAVLPLVATLTVLALAALVVVLILAF
jgi:hypothetical protein